MSTLGDRLKQEVIRLAAESPDFIYESPDEDQCVYVHEGEPSCLYGQALWNLGLIDASLERRKVLNVFGRPESLNFQMIDDLLKYLELEVDEDEAEAFIKSQDAQDNGRPWDVAARKLAS